MFLYFITGMLINASQGKSGKELIPNHKFWTELPGLVKVSIPYQFVVGMSILKKPV